MELFRLIPLLAGRSPIKVEAWKIGSRRGNAKTSLFFKSLCARAFRSRCPLYGKRRAQHHVTDHGLLTSPFSVDPFLVLPECLLGFRSPGCLFFRNENS